MPVVVVVLRERRARGRLSAGGRDRRPRRQVVPPSRQREAPAMPGGFAASDAPRNPAHVGASRRAARSNSQTHPSFRARWARSQHQWRLPERALPQSWRRTCARPAVAARSRGQGSTAFCSAVFFVVERNAWGVGGQHARSNRTTRRGTRARDDKGSQSGVRKWGPESRCVDDRKGTRRRSARARRRRRRSPTTKPTPLPISWRARGPLVPSTTQSQ